ncbi:MAG: lysophospholipid acyltransferase family protein [Caldilineaceae bacterium]
MSSDTVAAQPLPQKERFALGTGIVNRSSPFVRRLILKTGRGLGRAFLKVLVIGRENLPATPEPLIVIANHFGWFDAFILTVFLPFQPVFLVATESQRKWYVRFFMNLFDGIPIWRGQVDRDAFRDALKVLNQGRPLGVFPEGGINPELAARVAAGELITTGTGPTVRIDGKLARAKPGTALLATMSRKRILPVALLGTDQVAENMRRLRRTPVTIAVGPIFGPLAVDPSLTGPDKREQIDRLSDEMMYQVARMFPPAKRGPYEHWPAATATVQPTANPTAEAIERVTT